MGSLDNVDVDKLEKLCALIELVDDERTYEALVKLVEVKCLMMRATDVKDSD